MTKEENTGLLREREKEIRRLRFERKGDMETLSQWLERCRREIEAMEVDCQYPYACIEGCYCYENGMREEKA